MIDPYKILGVPKTATQEEIKKAYRTLAKKNHPDLNPGNKKAEALFKDISHANDLIGNPESRAKFDRGEIGEHEDQNWEQFYRHSRQKRGGRNNRYSQKFGDQFEDTDWFSDFFGGHYSNEDKSILDVHFKMSISFKDSVLGTVKIITLPNGKNLEIKIPAGIKSGEKLRFKNQGEHDPYSKNKGNLYIEIEVLPLPGWSRNGNDIETELPISFFEGIMGANVSVMTMHGPVMLTIPPGVSSGVKLRIKGKGIQSAKGIGSQIVKLKVILPKDTTTDFLNALKHLKEKYNYNPRNEQQHFTDDTFYQEHQESRG